jgi:hypothetical protein
MGKYLVFASIGFELVGMIIGSYYLGQALDNKYQTNGLIFVGLSVFSLIAWLTRVIFLLKKMEKDDTKL